MQDSENKEEKISLRVRLSPEENEHFRTVLFRRKKSQQEAILEGIMMWIGSGDALLKEVEEQRKLLDENLHMAHQANRIMMWLSAKHKSPTERAIQTMIEEVILND
jgi:hypothetical protein